MYIMVVWIMCTLRKGLVKWHLSPHVVFFSACLFFLWQHNKSSLLANFFQLWEKKTAICNYMNRLWGFYTKWNKPDRERKYCMVLFIWAILKTNKQKLVETESKEVE